MMTDLFEKSIATLGSPGAGAAGRLRLHPGGERCLSLRPMTDPDDVQRAQERPPPRWRCSLSGDPSFSGVKPVGPASTGRI